MSRHLSATAVMAEATISAVAGHITHSRTIGKYSCACRFCSGPQCAATKADWSGAGLAMPTRLWHWAQYWSAIWERTISWPMPDPMIQGPIG